MGNLPRAQKRSPISVKSIVSLGCLAERANARFCTCIALSMRAAAHLLLLLVGATAEETFHLHHTRVVVSKKKNCIRVYCQV